MIYEMPGKHIVCVLYYQNHSFLLPLLKQGPGHLNELGSWITTHTSLSPIRRGFTPDFVNYKKGALDVQHFV